MPVKAKKKVTRATARRVAAKRAAGRTVRQIAREEGISYSTAAAVGRREAPLIQRLTDLHEAAFFRMYAKSLVKLERDLGSKSARTRHDARQSLLKYVCAPARLQISVDVNAGEYDLQSLMAAWGKLGDVAEA